MTSPQGSNNKAWSSSAARDPIRFTGVSTPLDQRQNIGGLVPAAYIPLEKDVERCMQQLRRKQCHIEKYTYIQGIQDVNERLYYAMLVKYTEETMPIVYTPTVGEACERYSEVYRGTLRGMFFSLLDAGKIRTLLDNWPEPNVTTIVVTDGERILGLGDLGANGMGIPVGKLALYTACAGIHPSSVLPVTLDVGTNNQTNLQDPYYVGLKQERERGPAYYELVKEFFDAAKDKFGRQVLIQFEDFGNSTAFGLLKDYQDNTTTFNDDIQGTASVALGGLIASSRLTGKKLSDHTFLFNGAGEAGTGIAELIAYAASIEDDVSLEQARKNIFMVDSKGLISSKRLENGGTLPHHKLGFAHDVGQECDNLLDAVNFLKPSGLIGVSAQPKTFTKEICELMASNNDRPIICALSNPTSKAECTAEEAYTWTNGQAIFSSGSPFPPVTLADGRRFEPGQGNNAYIFPGIGLGVLAAGSTKITDHDMLIAAQTLASQVTQDRLDMGSLYPLLSEIRAVSASIAVVIAENAWATGVATNPKPTGDMLEHVKSLMYDPFDLSQ